MSKKGENQGMEVYDQDGNPWSNVGEITRKYFAEKREMAKRKSEQGMETNDQDGNPWSNVGEITRKYFAEKREMSKKRENQGMEVYDQDGNPWSNVGEITRKYFAEKREMSKKREDQGMEVYDQDGNPWSNVGEITRKYFAEKREMAKRKSEQGMETNDEDGCPWPKLKNVGIPLEEHKTKNYEETTCNTHGSSTLLPPLESSLVFGKYPKKTHVSNSVKLAYTTTRRHSNLTSSDNENAPIYGELTIGSMQNIINAMKIHTNLNSNSRFLDVGSGHGKPNVHITQDIIGIPISYGIEIDKARWRTSMNCLHDLLSLQQQEQQQEQQQQQQQQPSSVLLHSCNCIFLNSDIQEASNFEPFTHVYMFSVGFNETLWKHLSSMWNASSIKNDDDINAKPMYLICYSNQIIKKYEFKVELIHQMPTSMHGSNESHTAYIYKRLKTTSSSTKEESKNITKQTTSECLITIPHRDNKSNVVKEIVVPCDPLYFTGIQQIQKGFTSLLDHVSNAVIDPYNNHRVLRKRIIRNYQEVDNHNNHQNEVTPKIISKNSSTKDDNCNENGTSSKNMNDSDIPILLSVDNGNNNYYDKCNKAVISRQIVVTPEATPITTPPVSPVITMDRFHFVKVNNNGNILEWPCLTCHFNDVFDEMDKYQHLLPSNLEFKLLRYSMDGRDLNVNVCLLIGMNLPFENIRVLFDVTPDNLEELSLESVYRVITKNPMHKVELCHDLVSICGLCMNNNENDENNQCT